MPANRLSPLKESLPQFAVVGKHKPETAPYVIHVALLREAMGVASGDEVPVWHTNPPIIAGPVTLSATPDRFARGNVHVVGHLDDFSAEDVQELIFVLSDIDSREVTALPEEAAKNERQALIKGFELHYKALPSVEQSYNDITGRSESTKFSCAGFVAECYRRIGIPLVEESQLPNVDLDVLRQGYGSPINNEERRKGLGLDGPGPWPVLMPGYLFHSLARDSEKVRSTPYEPQGVDEVSFPLEQAE